MERSRAAKWTELDLIALLRRRLGWALVVPVRALCRVIEPRSFSLCELVDRLSPSQIVESILGIGPDAAALFLRTAQPVATHLDSTERAQMAIQAAEAEERERLANAAEAADSRRAAYAARRRACC